MNYLFQGFKFIHTYIDKLLVINKFDCEYHLDKLELILDQLKLNGLKFNTEKYSFGKTKILYLGLWVGCKGVR